MENFIPPFLQLDFQITGRCNSRCVFCNCWKIPYSSEKDIPGKIWIETAKKLKEFSHIEYLCIGGGEPLLYKDIFEVLRSFTEFGINTVMVTNGTLFTPNTSQKIIDTGIKCIDFSIDGFEHTHDRLRGMPGLFRKCADSIHLLKKLAPEMNLGISSLICGENIRELPEFLDWVLQELPVDRINFQAYQQVTEYKGKVWWKDSMLWPNDKTAVITAMDYLAERTQSEKKISNHPVQCEKFKRYFLNPDDNLGIVCPAGTFNFSVSNVGDIVGCIAKGSVGSNITRDDPIKAYQEKFPGVRKKASVCKENCHFLINCYFPLHWSRWHNLVKDMVNEKDRDKPGRLILPPEVREITNIGDHPDLIKYDAHKHLDKIGIVSEPERRVLPLHYPKNTPCIYLCGDISEVHRWGVNLDEEDFFKQINELKQVVSAGKPHYIIVGVTRTNFHRLDKIFRVIKELKKLSPDTELPNLSITPLKGIKDRFYMHLDTLKIKGKPEGIEFRIVDERFDEFIAAIEAKTDKDFYIENELLRAMGPVSKDVFIGPRYLLLDLSGECNVDCVYCGAFSEYNKNSGNIKGFLDINIIQNSLVEAKEIGVEFVLLVGRGEPTLHPDFLELINLIKELGLKFNFSTNGTLLERYNNYLTDGSCGVITVSLSFASEESFRKIRPRSNPKLIRKIEKGIKNLAELKKTRNTKLPCINALFAICDYNCHEIVQMVEFAKKLGVNSIWFQMVHLHDFSKDILKVSSEKMQQVKLDLDTAKKLCKDYGIEFASFIDFELECYNETRGDWSEDGLLKQGCFVGWHFAYVFLRREIFFCCGARTIGYLDKDGNGFKELWFSDIYRRYRNDGLIMHEENPICLNGKTLYDKYCDSCDNHDQNNMMIDLLKKYSLLSFVQRHRQNDISRQINKNSFDLLFMNPFCNELLDYDTVMIIEYLKKYNITAAFEIKYSHSEQNDTLISKLNSISFKILAIKVLDEYLGDTFEVIQKVRKNENGFKIVLWGPGCRTEGQRRNLPLDLVDGIIFQNYEITFKELILRCRPGSGMYLPDAPYIPISPVKNISAYPFPRYKGFNMEKFNIRKLPLKFSRGCPYRCMFCSLYYEEGPYRVCTPQSIIDEINYHLTKNNIFEYVFQDHTIGGDIILLEKLCDLMISEKLPVIWEARHIVASEQTDFPFQKMADAGCIQLRFGFVSGSDRILKLMGKPFGVSLLEKSLKKAKQSEIQSSISLMIGFPNEDEADFKETVAFLLRNQKYIDQVDEITPCFIQPGCDLEISPEKHGIILPHSNHWRDWHNGSYNNYSFRVKKVKEIRILVSELGLIHDTSAGKDEETIRIKDQIADRYLSFKTSSAEPVKSETHHIPFSRIKYDPVAKGIFSNTLTFSGPETLEIDLTNNCNLSCIGCWCHSALLGNDKFSGEKKRKHLPTDKLLSLLKEARNLETATVQLSGAGEPFLHPGIWDIIRSIKKFHMGCNIITNFSLLDQSGVRQLTDLGVDAVTASIWAGDAETYGRTHPGVRTDLFDTIKENLSLLTKLREPKGIPKLKIYHVINTENTDSISSMVDFALQVGADAVEFQMVDLVPGKTDSLLPDAEARKRLLAQFNAIRTRSDYTEEFMGTDHLKHLDDPILIEELKEFGRLYPILPEGFSYHSDYNAIRCPNGTESTEKHISLTRNFSYTFVFDQQNCRKCDKKRNCPAHATETGQLRVQFMEILGAGSFLRRLTSSRQEIQEYERQIIDRVPCTVGWTYARISVDGNVIPCCKASDFPVGNIRKDSFFGIWQSHVYSEFRKKAKDLSKKDPYFSRINCYKSCDNLGMNLHTHLKLQNYRFPYK